MKPYSSPKSDRKILTQVENRVSIKAINILNIAKTSDLGKKKKVYPCKRV